MSKAPVRYRLFSTRCLRAPDDCFGSNAAEPISPKTGLCPLLVQ